MQQKTHDFLVRMQVPMATFGGDLMGEAIDFAIHEMRNNRFVTLTDIENFDFQCFFFVLCFTSSVFALTSPIHLTSSTTIKIATIRLNIVHTTFLIKAADFFRVTAVPCSGARRSTGNARSRSRGSRDSHLLEACCSRLPLSRPF